ncbi:Y+l amino acid transporter 2 [Plakobranchus ocellatus]|uniref:Y+l amino acid transporter 2 n=1 Tax=Plakobranchus ocellatus TaxID=259542 RepID=A0AAV4DZM5_9GAST|nr:Y+l amino acid transporter 2 [Plakobranchus ocellatus]
MESLQRKNSIKPSLDEPKKEAAQDTMIVEKATELERSLGLFNTVTLMLSVTGHVAVFITPGIIIRLAGSLVSCLILWCLGSLAVYSMALCFIEMATIFQKAGGPYLYVTEAFGNIPGFLIAWGYIALISGPFLAFLSQTAALYIITAIVVDADCDSRWFKLCKQILAGWILLTMAYLNCAFLKVVVKLQNVLTMMRIVAIGLIIFCGLYISFTRTVENFDAPLEGSHVKLGSMALGFVFVIFSLGGWQAICPLTEEIHNPEKTMPRAIHISFAVQVSLYMLTYVSYLSVLNKAEVIGSSAIALLFCRRVWQPLVPIMSLLVSLACIGALNTGIMGHSRVLYAAARKGVMPSLLNTLHPTYKTPMMSIMALVLYGIFLICSGGSEEMMEFIGLFSLIMSLNVISGLLYLRYTQPLLERPYKVPTLVAIMQVWLALILLVLIVYQKPVLMSVGIAIYLSGIPVYIFLVKWSRKPKIFVDSVGKVTALCQKLFQQVHE